MKDAVNLISEHVEGIAESIMKENYLSKDELIDKINTFLISALTTIIHESSTDLEREATDLKEAIGFGKYDHDTKARFNATYRLGKINDDIKNFNRAKHAISDYHEYGILKAFVLKKFGDKAMLEFYQLQPNIKIELMRTHIRRLAKQLTPNKDRKNEIVYSSKR